MEKVDARIRQRFIWPRLNSAVRRWVKVCRLCQNAKTLRGEKKFPLLNNVSGSFNAIVQIDHQQIYLTKSDYTGNLVMIDHFTKYLEVVNILLRKHSRI